MLMKLLQKKKFLLVKVDKRVRVNEFCLKSVQIWRLAVDDSDKGKY